MSAPARRNLLLLTIALILAALVFRRGFYAIERATLEIRYFWWVLLILGAGIWALVMLGRVTK